MTRPRPLDDERARASLGRWRLAGVLVSLVLVAAFPAYRAVESARRDEWAADRQAALIALGRGLWGSNCAACHGVRGEGVDAPALNAREFLEMSSDEQVHHLIAAGVPGTEMPAWWNELGGPLTDEQVRALVAYIRSWEPAAPSRPDWRNPVPSPEAAPSPEPAGHEEADGTGPITITVTESGCEPLEVEVEAGRPFGLRFANESDASTSLDLEGLGEHLHAGPHETVTVRVTAGQEGTYPFECLGEAHGGLLGAGVIHAI